MKNKLLVLFFAIILFSSCADNKKQIVDNYLHHINNNFDKENLSIILDENFSYTFLEKSKNKMEFLNDTLKTNKILLYQSEILEYKIVNDSIIETIETLGNIFQNRTNLIPKFKIQKTYVIIDNKICKIVGDTLNGYSEVNNILSYVSSDFVNWMIENKIEDNDYSIELLSSSIDKFYESYPLQEIIENKKYLIDKFIEFVKNYEFNIDANKITYEDLFNKVAGLEGTVEWSSFVPDKYLSTPNIRAVEIFIDRNIVKSEYRTLKLQYLVNHKNKIAELKYGEINGKPVSLLDISLAVELILGLGSYI